MKRIIVLPAALFIFLTSSFGQQTSAWDKWDWLMGEWKGEGNGQTGQGSGTFSLEPGLDNNVLIRKNHSEYPATEKKPKTVHDDLMVVYKDFGRNPSKAIYFDNEGHTINYFISYADKSIVLTSEKITNLPVFRLSYILIDQEMINVKFEMSPDGEKFTTYTEGKCKKIK